MSSASGLAEEQMQKLEWSVLALSEFHAKYNKQQNEMRDFNRTSLVFTDNSGLHISSKGCFSIVPVTNRNKCSQNSLDCNLKPTGCGFRWRYWRGHQETAIFSENIQKLRQARLWHWHNFDGTCRRKSASHSFALALSQKTFPRIWPCTNFLRACAYRQLAILKPQYLASKFLRLGLLFGCLTTIWLVIIGYEGPCL